MFVSFIRESESNQMSAIKLTIVQLLYLLSVDKALLILDSNVDVIYISPVPVNEEMMQYYAKLLGLKAAIETGDVDNQGDISDRFKIIVPEAVQSFPVRHKLYKCNTTYVPM